MTLLGCVRPERSLPLQDHVAVDDDDIAYSSDDLESAKGGREELNSINGHSKLPKMQHVKRLGHQTKAKAKKALRLRETQANIEEDDASISKALEQNPAFAPEKALAGHQQNLSGKVKSTLGKVQDVGFAIINPKETVKHKATIKLATGEQPFLPQRADESLLDAHAALYDAQSRPSTIEEDSEDGEDIIKWQERINDLEEHRSSMKVAWTTSRFVHRVRVHRQVPIEYPTREELEEYDEHGNYVRFQWEKWFARLLLRLAGDPATRAIDNSDFGTFDRDLFAQHIERIITASGPLQEWFINLRKIYRWEDPKLSATWFIVFLLLWYLDCVITFGHVWVVFVTVKNRYRKGSLEALRESYERTVDRGTKAYKFSELISKHGQGDWLDPLVEQIGPSIELQV
ncbi:hypothetical protein M501DRAFT_949417 [Patellaria atrata CBS 101060]|uniref:Uncharacterized protein n=1 Tax=Patellaria atrata CBS 101060 TaxID=1346257 RepID=A0A9P4SEA2_9PEZI|nr:hypothetical protein M501DRAFT_949417 [Patellaria atrata CBS 101060]